MAFHEAASVNFCFNRIEKDKRVLGFPIDATDFGISMRLSF